MDQALADCFADATREVLGEIGLEVTHAGTAAAGDVPLDERCVIATVGLTGDLTGSFLLRLTARTALNVVTAMYRSLGLDNRDPQELTDTAIAEMANQITGRAITFLSRRSLECDMTPPAVIMGNDITSALPGIADGTYRSLDGTFGQVLILLGLRS